MLFFICTALITSACATPTYKSEVDTSNYINANEGLSYYLPRQLHKLELTRDKECNTTLTLTEGDLVPDETVTFLLTTANNPVRDDTLNIKTTSTGLLTSSRTTTSGQLGEIITQVAGALAAVPSSTFGVLNVRSCQKRASNFIAQYDIAKVDDRKELKKEAMDYGFTINFSTELTSKQNSLSKSVTLLKDKSGIFYRRPQVFTASVKCETNTKCTPDIITINLPQFGNVGYIEPKGSSFTAESDTLTFSNGMLTDWNTVRKSSVAEIAKLPVKVMEEIISVPNSLLTLRSTRATNTNTLETNLETLTQTQNANDRASLRREIELAIITDCLSKAEDSSARLECLNILQEQ